MTSYGQKFMHATSLSGVEESLSVAISGGKVLVAEYDVTDKFNMIITPNIMDEFGVDYGGRSLENTFIEEGLVMEEDIPRFSGLFSADDDSDDISINIKIFNKKKEFIWYKVSSLKIRDEQGKLCKLLIVITNIENEIIYKNELELTESAYVDSPEMLIEKVEILQKSGFKVLMDDFGSGYSSLNMLKDVPVDKLKIDLKFLEGITESERGGDILKTMMHLASVLNIPTIAEGVESVAQADILIGMGCDYVQGYLFNRPMPIDDFEKNCLGMH